MLTQKILKDILLYNPDTGLFTWKHRADRDSHWNGHYAGKPAGNHADNGYMRIAIKRGA